MSPSFSHPLMVMAEKQKKEKEEVGLDSPSPTPLEGKYLCQVEMASPNPGLTKTVVSKSCLYTAYRTFKYARTTVQSTLLLCEKVS